MAENKNRMNNEPVFGSLAYDLNTLNWEQLDGNAVPGSTPPPFWWAAWPFWP